ncbi:DUF1796 family putative cysteine peptidase [Paenibacillus odorifer]|uniref:Peptidase n=1 Tax=Paenibacillus odorifer TaxID=189426 RepID=A0A1R0Y6U9_9BACL|nr:DUF1796 family putative cysteine peptidase [Paenibacillus odorifer]OMD43048.1 hypothetical protein BSK52_05985 [Paenibacillus odorifer]
MKLQDVKESYDLIVSLGMSCAPAINMQRNNLRKFSMPLDWMVSYSLADVNKLFKSRFENFMGLINLQILADTHFFLEDGLPVYPNENKNALVQSYFIRDIFYNIISVHDFPITMGKHWSTTYPTYKAKLDLRIKRFWDKLINSKKTLFIRWSATYEQAVELQAILSDILKPNEFNVLILNPVRELTSIREIKWDIDNVCVLEVPDDMNDYDSWDYILKDIQLTNP